jgi:hypothetical protein
VLIVVVFLFDRAMCEFAISGSSSFEREKILVVSLSWASIYEGHQALFTRDSEALFCTLVRNVATKTISEIVSSVALIFSKSNLAHSGSFANGV